MDTLPSRGVDPTAWPGPQFGTTESGKADEKEAAMCGSYRENTRKQLTGRQPRTSSVLFMATTEQQDIDPYAAAESLRAALAGVGIVFPSLSVDTASPALRLVELGS